MAAALLGMGRIRGVHRPAIAVPLPVFGADRGQLLVDGGATVDPQPVWLVEWAVLARAYARVRLGVDEPTVGLLSNGEEPGKGDALRKAAAPLLAEVKGWVGNVEGRDLLRPSADVILTDGFTGNVALKTVEGTAKLFSESLRAAFQHSTLARIGYLLARGALKKLAARIDPRRYNGAMFLGLGGIAVKSHGSTDAFGFANAVGVAIDMKVNGFLEKIRIDLARVSQVVPAPQPAVL